MEWLEFAFAGLIRQQSRGQIRGQLECMRLSQYTGTTEQKTALTQYLSKAWWQFGDLELFVKPLLLFAMVYSVNLRVSRLYFVHCEVQTCM